MSEGSGEGFFGKLFGGRKRRKEAVGRKVLEKEFAGNEERLRNMGEQVNIPGWSHPNDALLAEQLAARQNEIRKQLGIPEQNGTTPASSENTSPLSPLPKPEPKLQPITSPSAKTT